MADFDKTSKINSTQDALSILASLRSTYASMKKLQGLVARYVGGADPDFTSAVDSLFSISEINELGVILGKIGSLVTDLEANHQEAIGL